jgi:hypothetical protein
MGFHDFSRALRRSQNITGGRESRLNREIRNEKSAFFVIFIFISCVDYLIDEAPPLPITEFLSSP